jgi:oxidase EvaA
VIQRHTAAVVVPDGSGVLSTVGEFDAWWARRRAEGRFEVCRIPFADLDAWNFEPDTGNLRHDSGQFFSIEGCSTSTAGEVRHTQPIINQPEIGVLGIVVKEFDGIPYCLMQAKMEPGNVNALQLSPTVQATRSNYTQVHHGNSTRYLEYFRGPHRGEVLVDVLQSEQGAWFWRKRNRNIVVRVTEEVPLHEDFRWLPLDLVHQLLGVDNLVNMDARTVLSCMPFVRPDARQVDGAALHSDGEVLSWLTEAKTRCDWMARIVPFAEVHGWRRAREEIVDDAQRDFRIIAVRVTAGNREVKQWTQPLLFPRGQGLAVVVVREIQGVPHFLAHVMPEAGLLDQVEMGPTVQLLPGQAASDADPFVRAVAEGTVGKVRFDTLLSEEGGRFHHALTRYRIVQVDDVFPIEVPADYCWLTFHQLTGLLRHGHYLNIEARSLFACAHSL